MKAWRVYQFNDMRLDEVPVPKPPPGWILLRVLTAHPSVTEVTLFSGVRTAAYDTIAQRMATEAPVALFGHEFVGEVAELGAGVSGFQLGQRVVARGEGPCHQCNLCLAGKGEDCRQRIMLGWTCAGAFAEWMVAPADILAPVPDTTSDSEAASIQPLSDAAAALEAAGIRAGDTVAIIGQGVMGLMCLQVARCLKGGTIIVVDVNRDALELAATMQADFMVDSGSADPVEEVLKITGGLGAELVFDAAGGNPKAGLGGINTFYQAAQMARQGGRVVPIALFSEPLPVDTSQMRDWGLRVIFPPTSSQETLLRCIDWVAAGSVRLAPLITHVLDGLDQVPQAFAITANKRQYRAIGPAQIIVHSGRRRDAVGV